MTPEIRVKTFLSIKPLAKELVRRRPTQIKASTQKMLLTAITLVVSTLAWSSPQWIENSEINLLFSEKRVTGTMVVVEQHRDQRWAHNPQQAQQRFGPASTFKI